MLLRYLNSCVKRNQSNFIYDRALYYLSVCHASLRHIYISNSLRRDIRQNFVMRYRNKLIILCLYIKLDLTKAARAHRSLYQQSGHSASMCYKRRKWPGPDNRRHSDTRQDKTGGSHATRPGTCRPAGSKVKLRQTFPEHQGATHTFHS